MSHRTEQEQEQLRETQATAGVEHWYVRAHAPMQRRANIQTKHTQQRRVG